MAAIFLLLLVGTFSLAFFALVLTAVCAIAMAPTRSRQRQAVRHWEAQDRLVRNGQVIIYWRPGCLYCTRLRLRLGALGSGANWVDIWADPEAAAFVRDVNGGAETVPTVILSDGEALTNPDPHVVKAELARSSDAAAA